MARARIARVVLDEQDGALVLPAIDGKSVSAVIGERLIQLHDRLRCAFALPHENVSEILDDDVAADAELVVLLQGVLHLLEQADDGQGVDGILTGRLRLARLPDGWNNGRRR